MDFIAAALATETVASSSSPVSAIAGSFGLNFKLFLAQLFNFGLLMLILWRLVYRPLVVFMQERSKRIAEGLDNAKRYDEKLKELETERQNVLARAEKEAQKILASADEETKRMNAEATAEDDRAAAAVIARANREIEQAKLDMIGEVRRQAADLVVLAAEKVIHERLDEKADRQLIERALKEVRP